ncbi:MAG: hypothetical protein KC731_27585, partial [Myxococcales bacterium]|nr:hypothetical protein [Myxococcales bacterium]
SSTSSVDSTAFMTPIADHADIHRPYFLLNFLHTLTPWARTPGAEIPVGFYGMYEHDRFFAGAERSDHALHFGVRLSFPSQSEGRVLRRDM